MTKPLKRIRSTATESCHVRPSASGISVHVRAESHNAENRSFDAVIITDAMTISMNAWTFEPVADVVLLDNLSFTDPLPIVDSHVASLYTMVPTSEIRGHVVLGSIRDEIIDGVNAKVATLVFDRDEDSEELYQKVLSGSVKNLSPGYTITRGVEISPGESAVINGRTFTAPQDKPLLVGTQAKVTEISAVLRGADPLCRIRAAQTVKTPPGVSNPAKPRGESNSPVVVSPPSSTGNKMEKELREYLVRCGMDANASDADAETYYGQLTGDQAVEARRLRSAGSGRPAPAGQPVDAERIRAEERARISEIEQLAGDDTPRDLVRQAIDNNWTADRASRAFLEAMRDRRNTTPGVPAGAPAAHVRSGNGPSVRSLVLAQLLTAGVDLDSPALTKQHLRSMLNRYDLGFIVDETRMMRSSGRYSDAFAREIDTANQITHLDSREFCTMLLRAQQIDVPLERREMVRTAFSGGNLSGVLEAVAFARVAIRYNAIEDWTREVFASGNNRTPNAEKHVRFGTSGNLLPMPRGGSPNMLSVGEDAPTVKTQRNAASLVIDELDILSGSFANIESTFLEDMAENAVNLRMEKALALLMKCESFVYTGDNAAVCSAGRKNLLTGAAMEKGSLTAARKLMRSQKFNGKTVNQQPAFLITPDALWGDATALLNGAEIRSTASETTVADAVQYSTFNPVRNMNLRLYATSLLDNGFTDPYDPAGQAQLTGSETKFWLLADRAHSPIELTGLEGFGDGSPELTSSPLSNGQRGMQMNITTFVEGNYVNTTGLVACRP